MEAFSHHVRALSGQAYGRRANCTGVLHLSLPATVPLVCYIFINPASRCANVDYSGECAEHFGQILKKYPPQVSTRTTAATWGCHVHNEVNKSLKKEIFDCSNIGDFYDCGCADDEEDDAKGGKKTAVVDTPPEKPEMDAAAKERLTSTNGRDINVDLLSGDMDLKLEKEG